MFSHRHILNLFILVPAFCISSDAIAGELPRAASFGMYAGSLSDSAAKAAGLPQKKGIVVNWIRPNTTEAAAGLKQGDILLSINGEGFQTVTDFLTNERVAGLRGGDSVRYEVWRNYESVTLRVKAISKPREEYDEALVEYGSIPFRSGYLSTILVTPRGAGPHPVVYLIPGYNCASYDWMPEHHPYRRILDSLIKLGYAVFRCEKTGMGDCQGTPNCFDSDFLTEQEAFETGFEKLTNSPKIDRNNIFIFGHSLGGINAPLLAEKAKIRGLIVYGTSHLPWSEYLVQMLRFQNPRLGIDRETNENDMRIYHDFLHDHYVLQRSLGQLSANKEYVRLLERDFQYEGTNMLFQRREEYWQQIHQLELSKAWANLDCKVLSVFGEADFEALNSFSHEEIIRIVNHNHPGNGTYKLLPGTTHGFTKVGSMEDGIAAQQDGSISRLSKTNFNYDFVTMMDEWMRSVMEE